MFFPNCDLSELAEVLKVIENGPWCVVLAILATYLKVMDRSGQLLLNQTDLLNLPFLLFCLLRTGVLGGIGFYYIVFAFLEILETLNREYLNFCFCKETT